MLLVELWLVQSGALSIIQFHITFPLGYIKKILLFHIKKKSFTQFSIFFILFNYLPLLLSRFANIVFCDFLYIHSYKTEQYLSLLGSENISTQFYNN